ncbi:MAG: hypothetical protein ONB13_09665, partial [candidate division KSB1 bacterium]|nr:hypothetical protein [candidate division KSB1 bacterium]
EAVNTKIADDGYSLFTIILMMVIFKGILVSMAGPAPNYDMQRVLATRSPKEASKMSWFVSICLFPTRYLMITGIAVLALVFFSAELRKMGPGFEFHPDGASGIDPGWIVSGVYVHLCCHSERCAGVRGK